MGSLLRSADIVLLQVFTRVEYTRITVQRVLSLGCVEIRDVNQAESFLKRRYTPEIQRIDEAERRLVVLEESIGQFNREFPNESIKASTLESVQYGLSKEELEELLHQFQVIEKEIKSIKYGIEGLERELYEHEDEIQALQNYERFFRKRKNDLEDDGYDPVTITAKEKWVQLKRPLAVNSFPMTTFETAGHCDSIRSSHDNIDLAFNDASDTLLHQVYGVIDPQQVNHLSRAVFRIGRGNVAINYKDIQMTFSEKTINNKTMSFLMLCPTDYLKQRIEATVHSFGGIIYSIPNSVNAREKKKKDLAHRKQEIGSVLSNSYQQRYNLVLKIAGNISSWKSRLQQEKTILHTMNMLNGDITSNHAIMEAWCPNLKVNSFIEDMQMKTASGEPILFVNRIATHEIPPTYFPQNSFTRPFQKLVEIYGVPSYEEINPAPFTIITFPFLFAVMYGDVGHGVILTMLSLLLIYVKRKHNFENQDLEELYSVLFEFRYLILLLGLFSTYAGLIYGELFSLSIPIFESSFKFADDGVYATQDDSVYPFGVDHNWIRKENELEFFNSLKMKLSMIFGVLHMCLGLFLCCMNFIRKRNYVDIVCNLIPQVLLLLSTFGYIVALIIIKWSNSWKGRESEAPFIINIVVDMLLAPGTVEMSLYKNQEGVQMLLFGIIFFCIPWMIFLKPIWIYMSMRSGEYSELVARYSDKSFADLLSIQSIHAIEVILGTISNSASYLRLWALSLAHAELSKVIWDQTMIISIKTGNSIFVFVSFTVWIFVTIFVMMVMESLSAFLHTIRLHWIEFQNKFFAGEGVAFSATSFSTTIDELRSKQANPRCLTVSFES